MRTLHSFTPPSSVSFRLTVSSFQPRRCGVHGVHPQQRRGEQRRLLAAGTRPDLQNDAAAGHWGPWAAAGASAASRSRSISSRAADSSSWASSRSSGSESISSAAARSRLRLPIGLIRLRHRRQLLQLPVDASSAAPRRRRPPGLPAGPAGPHTAGPAPSVFPA